MTPPAAAPAAAIAPLLAELIALRAQAGGARAQRCALPAAAPGSHGAETRSRGMTFFEARPYQQGDDARSIDWRQTARRGKVYTKLFQAEQERPTHLLVDLGPSMQFGTRVAFKAVIAARIAALLAWSTIAAGDRIGGLVCNGGAQRVVRLQGRHHGALAFLGALADCTVSDEYSTTDLAAPLLRLARTLQSGSTAIVVSDFAALDAASARALAALAARCELILVQVYDQLEAAPPPPGIYPVSDGRTSVTLDLHASAARAGFSAAYAARRARLEQLARRPNTRLLSCATHDDPRQLVRRLLAQRTPCAA